MASCRVRSSGCVARSAPTGPGRSSGLRPNGEGPLKQIVNALTGQKPESAAGAETDKEPASESPAPAA